MEFAAAGTTEEQKICSICYDEIINHAKLTCDHTFCSECIAKIIESMDTETADRLEKTPIF